MGHLELHAHLLKKWNEAQEIVTQIKKNPNEKMFTTQTKKVINTRITQICANVKRIQECSIALCGLLETTETNPLRKSFKDYMIAYRIADEAEVGIKSSTRAAWPVAYVAAQVFHKSPAVEELFRGFMHTSCPYVVPDFAGCEPGHSATCPGQRETENYGDFVDRMVGYLRLWFAVAVVQDDLSTVWQWLARTLNAQPVPIAASFLHCSLELAGAAAQRRYKKQFVKLVSVIELHFMPALDGLKARTRGEEADRLRASLSRLQVWLTSFKQHGAPQPDGQRIEAREESELNPDI